MPRLNTTQPVNPLARLNRGRVLWFLCLPNREQGGGVRWRDLMRKRNGTLTNGPVWKGVGLRPGGFGCLSLDGTNDFIDVSTSGATNLNSSLTIAVWMYCTNVTANRTMFYLGTSGTGANIGFEVGRTSGKLSAITNGTVAITGSGTLSASTWYRVAIVRSGAGTSYATYINGVLDASAGTTGIFADVTSCFVGKGITAGREFPGFLDDVSVWSRALSASEIAQDYRASRTGYRRELNWITQHAYSDQIAGGSLLAMYLDGDASFLGFLEA